MIDPALFQRLADSCLPVLLDAAAKGVVLLIAARLLVTAMPRAENSALSC